MPELRDSFIKLFGKTIVHSNGCVGASDQNLCSASGSDWPEIDQEVSKKPSHKPSKDEQDTNATSKTPSADAQPSTLDPSNKTESESHEKTPKKPEKILPCPRCDSADTKFCYYNNYNIHQPRYFCKDCQRYWTAGGTMRNVPIGAGRRKNKKKNDNDNAAHVTASEPLQTATNVNVVAFTPYPAPFYPAEPYWGCNVLGKRPRDDHSVLVPKTLRIDDPSEAAKSSIWAALGIRREKGVGGIFESFLSGNGKDLGVGASAAMRANPAAMSRSENFRENT